MIDLNKAWQKPTHFGSELHRADIFSLPTELHVQVFLELQYQDLCSFRALSTRARDLLAEGEIVRQWLFQNTDRHQLKLYLPGAESTFQHLLNQQRRSRTATVFATLLADYVEQKILRYTMQWRDEYPIETKKELLHSVTKQLGESMIPLTMTVQHYLEQSASILIEASSSSSTDYRPTYRSQERKIFEKHDSEHLHLAHQFWMFLIWLSDQILHRPSYAGALERTVRGWSMEPLNRFDYRLLLLFGNVNVLVKLLQAGTPKQRRKTMDSWLARLDPDRDVQWQQHWQKATAACGRQLSMARQHVKRVLDVKLSARDLWVESAEAVLIAKDELLPQEDGPIGTPQQVRELTGRRITRVSHTPRSPLSSCSFSHLRPSLTH